MQLLKYAVQELLLLSKPLLLCPKAKQLVTVLTQLLVVFTEPNLNPFGLPSYLLFQFAIVFPGKNGRVTVVPACTVGICQVVG